MIDPAEATDPEILAAVEAWARARGMMLWQDPVKHGIAWGVNQVASAPAGPTVWHFDKSYGGEGVRQYGSLSPLVALAWALAVEADERVDVGRCPACVARSPKGARKLATVEWGMATAYGRSKPYIDHPRWHTSDGWTRGWGGRRRKGQSLWVQHYSRPCPDCNGTGRGTRELASLVLDAAPVRHEERNLGTWWMAPGDPTSIDALTVHAERLMLTTLPDAPGEPVVSPSFASHKEAREWAAANAMPGDTFQVHRSRDPRNLGRPEYVAEVRRADHRSAARARIELGELLALYLHRWSAGAGREGTAEAVRLVRGQKREPPLLDRLLAAVGSGDRVVEVSPTEVVGRSRVEVARQVPMNRPAIAMRDEPVRGVDIEVERFVFDIRVAEIEGRRRVFAVLQGTPDDLALHIIHALLSVEQVRWPT